MGLAPGLPLFTPSFDPDVGRVKYGPASSFVQIANPSRPASAYARSIIFFASTSGSVTMTAPLQRRRQAFSVVHQLRAASQRKPASCNT
jgi:hypothetical protein